MPNLRALWGTARDLRRELSQDQVSDLAASLSYRFLLALFPFFIFLGALGGLASRLVGVENPAPELLDRFGGALPSDARSLLATQLDAVLGEQRPGLLSFGLLLALWAASSGMGSTMRAMNRAYDVEETRPFWKRTGLAIGLTVLTGSFFIMAFVLAVVGQAVERTLATELALGNEARAALVAGRFAIALALLSLAVAFLYWAAPNAKLPFKWLTPGSVMFVLSWFIGSLAFGWYVSNFGSYNDTYGALGGVVVLMIWFYLTALMLLAGAELNALLAQKQEPEALEAPAPESEAWRGTERGGEQRANPGGPRPPSIGGARAGRGGASR